MSTEWSDDIRIAELSDEPALSDELSELIEEYCSGDEGPVPHVVLNFAGVSYINSSNIAQLLRLRKRLAEAGRHMKLCAVGEQVWSVLAVTGLDKVLEFAPDPMTALASVQLDQSGE